MEKKLFILSFCFLPLLLFSQNAVHQWNTLNTTPKSIFETAFKKTQGVAAINSFYPQLSFIGPGTVSAEVIGNPVLMTGPRPTHFPIDEYKRVFTGIMPITYKKSPAFDYLDDDYILYIKPNKGFSSFENYLKTGKTAQKKIEAEIDINSSFWPSISSNRPNLFSQISIYGAWVHEKHDYWDTRYHDYLEVHPCENIWWSNFRNGDMKYTICVFSDNSGNFNRWRPNPLNAVNGIAFKYITGEKSLNYEVDILTSLNMLPSQLRNVGQNKLFLKDGADTIAVVEKPSGPNVYFSVEFSSVEKKLLANGKYSYKGFIKIYTTVKDGGHCIYQVTEKNKKYQFPEIVEVTVKLESITCLSVNDGRFDDDGENVYGSYGIAPVPGENSLLPNYTNLSFSQSGIQNNILWERKDGNSIPLKKGQSTVINNEKKFILPISGEFVLYGDLDEDDGDDGDDKVGEPQMQTISAAELDVQEPKKIAHVYESNGTKFEVKLSVQRKNINQISNDNRIDAINANQN